jgi:hypothetical protein
MRPTHLALAVYKQHIVRVIMRGSVQKARPLHSFNDLQIKGLHADCYVNNGFGTKSGHGRAAHVLNSQSKIA